MIQEFTIANRDNPESGVKGYSFIIYLSNGTRINLLEREPGNLEIGLLNGRL